MSEAQNLFPEPEQPQPDAVIEFEFLPSINDMLAAARVKFGIGNLIKRWRTIAEGKAVALARSNDIAVEDYIVWLNRGGKRDKPEGHCRLRQVLFTRPLAVEIHVWRPDDHVYDVGNIFHKPIFDGFVDARLILTDSVKQIKEIAMIYDGVDRALALTRDERRARREENARRKLAGRKPLRQPTRARFTFEFFTIED